MLSAPQLKGPHVTAQASEASAPCGESQTSSMAATGKLVAMFVPTVGPSSWVSSRNRARAMLSRVAPRVRPTMVLARALSSLPPAIIDSHHHYIKPPLAGGYLPAAYNADAGDLNIQATVHIEACGGNGDALSEVQWLESLVSQDGCKPLSIVARCDLAAPDAADSLKALVAASPRVKGIRWVLDYDGDDSPATHNFVKNNGLRDYLRDPAHAPRFEAGYALLAEHGLSFDLQCAPAQLNAAAALCARHPGVPVVLDHLGKPRALQGDGGAHDVAELATWRAGMAALAALPHVHVKLSMLAFAVPGWVGEPAKEAFLRDLVLETIGLFGARRCLFNANWCGAAVPLARIRRTCTCARAHAREHACTALLLVRGRQVLGRRRLQLGRRARRHLDERDVRTLRCVGRGAERRRAPRALRRHCQALLPHLARRRRLRSVSVGTACIDCECDRVSQAR